MYKNKYLKYKNKYLKLQNHNGGECDPKPDISSYDPITLDLFNLENTA